MIRSPLHWLSTIGTFSIFFSALWVVEAPRAVSAFDGVIAEAKVSGTVADPKVTANPLVTAQPIVFVSRAQYPGDHHNTATMFQTGELNANKFRGPGAIKLIDFADGGKITTLLEVRDGIVRDIDVSFDGKRILFSMRCNRDDDYHIYEMSLVGEKGSGPFSRNDPKGASQKRDLTPFPLKQLTFGPGISDIDPIYLPNGQILFGSTREPKFCMCNRHIMCNLFTMDADGANIQQIGHSTLHEGHASLLPDGRVIYDRWEYVDRNFGDAQGVWSVNPDGTNHAIYWGNNTNSPGAVLDNRAIPGTERFICTFSSCHDRPWGALAVIDRRLGIDGRAPVVRTWPPDAINLVGKGNYDTYSRVRPKYEDPYPLSDEYFLCSRMTGRGEQMGIYLLGMEGSETLLHSEAAGCFDPMPLGPRPKPPAIPPRIDLKQKEGYFYVADVYVGTGMDKIKRGEVKYLRVVESPEKRFWTRQAWQGSGTQAPGMAFNDFNNKRIIGTVPVEADGSAYFAVPADTFIYFQLLDENGMMVQSMRSGTIIRPGETTGCIGCHESRRMSVPQGKGDGYLLSEAPSGPSRQKVPVPFSRLAMLRPPRKLTPWYGPPRNFSYLVEVQPVFDKHCVECHDYGKEAGKKVNLAGDLGSMFNMSYYDLRTKGGLVKVPGAGPAQVLMPKSWGSHASRLGKVLLEGHGDKEIDEKIKLDRESFDRIVTWIDINAPYYPDYASAYRNNRFGRSPLDGGQIGQLGRLTGVNVGDQGRSWMVSFTRPEMSPCLQKLDKNDPKYKEALAIITAGKQMLAKRPRADMPGFCLVEEIEIRQEAKYQALLKQENEMRRAIADGKKLYQQQP